jgi:hypothetical protein
MKRDEWIPGIPRIVDVVAGWDFFLLRDESGHLWMGEGEVLRISDVGPSSSGINVLFSPQGGKAIRPERAEELFRVIARASLRL